MEESMKYMIVFRARQTLSQLSCLTYQMMMMKRVVLAAQKKQLQL